MVKCVLVSVQRGEEVNAEFWKDMVAAIDHNYNTSAFKGEPSTSTLIFSSRIWFQKVECYEFKDAEWVQFSVSLTAICSQKYPLSHFRTRTLLFSLYSTNRISLF